VLLAGLGSRLWQQRQQKQVEARKAVPLLPRQVSALGRIEPLGGISQVSVPSSLSNDRVREILVKEGQEVRKGQPLAVLESIDTLESSVRKSEAEIRVAESKLAAQDSVIARYKADLGQASAEARRAEQLFAAGATSANRVEKLQADESSAKAQVAEAIATTAPGPPWTRTRPNGPRPRCWRRSPAPSSRCMPAPATRLVRMACWKWATAAAWA
jgi:HlyD family secretion protein